jgi:chromosome segregation ATPase
MKKICFLYRLVLGFFIGIMVIPPKLAQTQWTVYDPAQYVLQADKKVEEAARWVEHYQKLVEQLTTLRGVLSATDDLVAKQSNAIATMRNVGRTVRASFQLKDQLEAIVTTRLTMIKRIDDRLRNGIFDPEADLRDLDEYLRDSIGRSSQDMVANRERLVRMDNQLAMLQRELSIKELKKSWAETRQKETSEYLKAEEQKPDGQQCASCIDGYKSELDKYELLITELEGEILDIRCKIEDRIKLYNIRMEERAKFGEQVTSTNKAWSEFNNALDKLQSTLSRID